MLLGGIDIDELQVKVFINEDIGRFHVTVCDFQFTHMVKCILKFTGDSF